MQKFVVMLVLAAGCVSAPPVKELAVTQRVEHLDKVAREPMLAEHPQGALFVAGYWEPRPTLWKSQDRGATWTRVDVGAEAEGNSDVDLAIAPDGTLYFMTMFFDRTTNEGTQIAMGVSRDAGTTWRWTTLSKNRFDDRPWIEVAPDGTAHAIWNDGSGVSHVVSRDRGVTWSPMRRIHDRGGSSHLVIGPAGELAVRITPLSASGNKYDEGVDLIAVSTDAGATWQKHPAPGTRDWSPDFESSATPRWVEPLAWDARGLHSLWADKKGVRLAHSADRGATWTTRTVADTAAPAFFPYLAARGNGALAATWFTASTNEMKDLQWHAALIDGDRVVLSAPQTIESRRPREPNGPLFNDPAGEYLPIAFLRDGTLGVATPIQNVKEGRAGFTWWRFAMR